MIDLRSSGSASPWRAEGTTETVIERDVVVGAGPAGPMAARTLAAAGRTIAVLDARDRAGGRTWSSVVDGAFLEVGGHWITVPRSSTVARMIEMACVFADVPRPAHRGAAHTAAPAGRDRR